MISICMPGMNKMKWLDERPRPIHETWNILCDAIEERIGAFRIDWDEEYLPPRLPAVPFSKTKFDVSGLRGKIITLIKYSFFPPWFGKWSDLRIDNLGIDRPDGEFYRELGIDGNAFFMRAGENVPSRKYSLNNFIHAAAKVVNDALLYPLPGKENSDRAGFLLDADLELHTFDPDYHWKGQYSTNGQRVVYIGDHTVTTYPYLLVYYLKDAGRTRAWNLCWKYANAGKLIKSASPFSYYSPALQGSGKLRMGKSSFSITDPDTEERYWQETVPAQEFSIDFETGHANRKVDISAVQKRISDYWNLNVDDTRYNNIYRVILERSTVQIMLQRENFPAINYKYLS